MAESDDDDDDDDSEVGDVSGADTESDDDVDEDIPDDEEDDGGGTGFSDEDESVSNGVERGTAAAGGGLRSMLDVILLLEGVVVGESVDKCGSGYPEFRFTVWSMLSLDSNPESSECIWTTEG